MKKVISMIVAIAMLVTMFSTMINLGTAFAAQDYEAALSYAIEATNANERNESYSKAIPAGVLGWAKYGYENAIAQMENANVTSFATLSSTGFTVSIESVAGKLGETITVPVKFSNIASVSGAGIMTCDLTVEYDATKLEFVSGEAGSIVTNPKVNFALNKETDGKIKMLFLDDTLSDQYISADGVFANLNFKVSTSAAVSTTVSISKGTFGNISLVPVSTQFINGTIELNGGSTIVTSTPTKTVTPTPTKTTTPPTVTGFTAQVDSVEGKYGDTITVPVYFVKVPSKGITTCDLTIEYDATKLEYVSGEAGSIVTNPSINYAMNKEKDGKIKILFLDETLSDQYISADGIFTNLKFKVLTSEAASTKVTITKATFGDSNLTAITADLKEGIIKLNGGGAIVPSTPTITVTPTPTKTTTPPTPTKTPSVTGFTAQIDSVEGKYGDTIIVPVYFMKVPSKGITTCDLTIEYDATKLEYVSGEAGDIVTNPSINYAINKETDGKIKMLFLDETLSDQYISSDGVFTYLKFKVLTSAAVSTKVTITKATFGDTDLKPISADLKEGIIKLNGGGAVETPTPTNTIPTPSVTGFTAMVDSVEGKYGDTITVPVYFLKVPSKGIMTCDLTIEYDATKLQYVNGEAGSIVTNPSINYAINKETDGKIKMLFLDDTLSDQYISADGVFTNLQFKVLTSAAVSTKVTITKATFGDIDLKPISADFKEGIIKLNGGGAIETSTPTKTPTPISTPTKTPTPISTPTKTPVISNLKVEFYNTNTQADSNSIYPKFRLTNTGSTPINLADLKLRYYYTIDGEKAQNFWCDWSPVGSSNVIGQFVKMTQSTTGADYYLEVSFSSGAGALQPNTPIEVQCRFAKTDWTNYNQANDYSFNSSATYYATWDKVTAYLSGNLVWGVEPIASATPTPTIVTSTPTITVTPTNTPTPDPNAMIVAVGKVEGKPGETVTVPVTLSKVPAKGIITANFSVTYDSNVLEYVSYEAGSIVKNPDINLALHKETDGLIKVLFLDETMSDEYIANDGVMLNLTFKIKANAKAGTSTTIAIGEKPTFGDTSLTPIKLALVSGSVTIKEGTAPATPTPTADPNAMIVAVGKVEGKAGETVTVPVTLTNVPANGVTTANFSVTYDSNVLEYVSYEAGSIVKNPDINLALHKQTDGLINVLFLDETLSDEYIANDGVMLNLTFKIKANAKTGTSTTIAFGEKATFADNTLTAIKLALVSGSVAIVDETSPVTPTPTETNTPTPTADPNAMTVAIGKVEGKPGETVTVPVTLTNVPANGVTTANFSVTYDSNVLEYVSYEAGSIVKNPTINLALHKQTDGLINVLFLDETLSDEYIANDGVMLNLTFKIKADAKVGTSTTIAFGEKATFADNTLTAIKLALVSGSVKVIDEETPATPTPATPTPSTETPTPTPDVNGFNVVIDTVKAAKGQEVIVPIRLINVPENGITAADMTIKYDTTKLEYIKTEAGNIIINPQINFASNEINGEIKLLFLDETLESQFISEDGVFAELIFKVIGDEGLAELNIEKINFADNDLVAVDLEYKNGGVEIGTVVEGFTVSGYINPDFVTTSTTAPIVNAGFKVEIVGTDKSAITDSKGYFEIKDVEAGTYTINITKDNYLTREIANVRVSDNIELSTSEKPLLMWAGDMIINGAQDGAINLEDIMEICKSFNAIVGEEKYKEGSDLNKDGAINLEDIMIVAKHFNKISADYK